MKKDDPLQVEGRLEYRSFQDEEGKERSVYEIVVSDVQFLGRLDQIVSHTKPSEIGCLALEMFDERYWRSS